MKYFFFENKVKICGCCLPSNYCFYFTSAHLFLSYHCIFIIINFLAEENNSQRRGNILFKNIYAFPSSTVPVTAESQTSPPPPSCHTPSPTSSSSSVAAPPTSRRKQYTPQKVPTGQSKTYPLLLC